MMKGTRPRLRVAPQLAPVAILSQTRPGTYTEAEASSMRATPVATRAVVEPEWRDHTVAARPAMAAMRTYPMT